MLKEKYLEVKKYLENDNIKKLTNILFKKLSSHSYSYIHKNENFKKLHDTYNWFSDISKKTDLVKSIIFGEVLISIDDIKTHVLEILKKAYDDYIEDEDEDEDEYGYYDYSGHSNKRGLNEVINFFENLDEYKIFAIICNEVQDGYDIDIDGGRSYLMSSTNINELIFNYIFHNKKYKYEDLENQLGEDIFYYEISYYINCDIYLPSIKELYDIYYALLEIHYNDLISRYNSIISNLVNNFKNEPILEEKIEIAKNMFIDFSFIKNKLRDEKLEDLIENL